MSDAAVNERSGYRLTGRTVLVILFAFFGTVASVNAVLVHYALSTFRGEVEDHPYEVGLAFNGDIAAARAQEARHWSVDVRLPRRGDRTLSISMRDALGTSLDGLKVVATFAAPVDSRLDHQIELKQSGAGLYVGGAPVAAGNWDLEIRADRQGETLFRSKSRIAIE
jgi:nitrogen fixation protein FixH